ncbi:hypothetical protein DRN74_01905 [Candidatus Micrarchaeota archaeon]|nr:MAG: hypothetical protein DRN74_01905 [Candidatus Micrarchaeota archaeon]
MKRVIALFLLFMVLLGPAYAKELIGHNVEIILEENGDAIVTEEYKVDIQNTSEFEQLHNLSIIAKNDLNLWKSFLNDIDFYVKGNIEDVSVSTETDPQFGTDIVIQYKVKNLAKISEERPRAVIRVLRGEDFLYYHNETKRFVIPRKNTLEIKISPSKRLEIIGVNPRPDSEIVEGAKVVKGVLTGGRLVYIWNKPLLADTFEFKFSVEKTISETFDLQRLATGLVAFLIEKPIYSITLLILLVLVIIYRKQIASLVIESFAGEEEISLPKKEL